SDTLGWALVHKKAYASAIAHFEDALEKLPANPTIHYHMGVAHHRSGNTPEATKHLEKALALNAPFPEQGKTQELLQAITSQ
ncbi:MAG: tetratricopeptide repeat protein, partial [Thermodesulfobacteriota bacterium]